MKSIKILLIVCLLTSKILYAQKIVLSDANLVANKVYLSTEKHKGVIVKVVKDSTIVAADEPTFARLKNVSFKNGRVELYVKSQLLPTAPQSARGFIGLAFRINDDNTKFECIYLRPTNGRAEDQLRRNHSIQYFSYPDYKFTRLRRDFPETYESYADMELNKWIKMTIILKDNKAVLYLNKNTQPSLIVNDLKHGANSVGSIGLFVDVGTIGYFRDLKIFIEE